jgi:hypothetical protein
MEGPGCRSFLLFDGVNIFLDNDRQRNMPLSILMKLYPLPDIDIPSKPLQPTFFQVGHARDAQGPGMPLGECFDDGIVDFHATANLSLPASPEDKCGREYPAVARPEVWYLFWLACTLRYNVFLPLVSSS